MAGSLKEIYPQSFLFACTSFDGGRRSSELDDEDKGGKWMALIAREPPWNTS